MANFAGIELELHNLMDVPTEDMTEEQKLALEAYQQELTKLESDKIDNFSDFIIDQIGYAKAIRENATRLLNRARAIENKVESLKSHYQFIMSQHDKTKIAGSVHSISIRKSKSVSVASDAIDALPDEYKKVTVEPRKSEIKKALESGIVLSGCEIVESQSLQIR